MHLSYDNGTSSVNSVCFSGDTKNFQMNTRNITLWILRLVPAIILLQTLYFKFSAHPQSVKLFTTIGMEPYGRIGTGILEGIAAILILIPRFTGFGALLGLAMMTGALYFHLTKLGIDRKSVV